ncbi:MAG TPA: YbhB/YbcL family Raf kinase inhibitor-like protein [Parachlamydiaceae bacterium]|nr:YbhB/YbcL family Raf kinase inhibitor-like protein [Parachlamydiaceae bacterium]
MEITSPVFEHHQTIPVKYTCQGENISPPLIFKEIPQNTKSLVLIMDDPDAPGGTFDHWLVWNIDPESKGLSEGQQGLMTGLNSYSNNQYKGPCPPPGKPHRYFFNLYALDTLIDMPASSRKQELEKAIQDHILHKAQLIGIFEQ